MIEKQKLTGVSRRGFVTSLATFTGVGLTGTELLARGGGGGFDNRFKPQIQYSDEDNDDDQGYQPQPYTQDAFLKLPRQKHLEYMQRPKVYVHGFSQNMSQHLFEMGYSDVRRTRGLVIRIRGLKNRRDRRNVLRAEYEAVRNDYENFTGS